MNVTIREVNVRKDRSLILKVLNKNRHLKKMKTPQQYDWKYLNNPFGIAKAWVAECNKTGEIIGVSAAFPRIIDVNGEKVLCSNCGDFSIHQAFRTFGPAMKLRLASMKMVDQGGLPFIYSYPVDRMKAVNLRVGHTHLGEMRQFTKILKIDPYLSAPLRGTWVAKSLGWGMNAYLTLQTGGFLKNSSCELEVHTQLPEKTPFSDLMEKLKYDYPVLGQRDAAYLQWRFWDNPDLDPSILILYCRGELVGYVIYVCKNHILTIKDILCTPDHSIINELLNHVTDVAHQLGVNVITAIIFETNPLINMLRRHGYRQRHDRWNAMVYVATGTSYEQILKDKRQWFMTGGDCDD